MSHSPPEGAQQDPLVGTIFAGRYRIRRVIGRGAAGTVYEAEQISMANRPVALKVIRPALVGDRQREGRFIREARAAGRLQHPNTIRLYDSGKAEDGRVYLVTELLSGETVGHVLRKRGRFDAPEAVRIVCEILKSLAEAHAAGLIHRDLKPDNVFLIPRPGEPDAVKVLDFGLVKYVTGTDSLGALTREGVVGGTPGYMSPENAQGRELDGRADIYSAGVLLFEMLTGERPFRAPDSVHVLIKHINEPPPPLVVPGIRFSDDLLDAVYRCLEKDRRKRPKSAVALRQELAGIRVLAHDDESTSEHLRGKGSLASQAAVTLAERRLSDVDTVMLDRDQAAPYVERARGIPDIVDTRIKREKPPRPSPGPPLPPDEISTAEVPSPPPDEPGCPTTDLPRVDVPDAGRTPARLLFREWAQRVNWEAVFVFGLLAFVVVVGLVVAGLAFGLF